MAALAAAGEPVRALVRDPAKAALPAGAEDVEGDLNKPETFADALTGARGMFLLPGYDNIEGLQQRYVDAFFSFYVDRTLDEATVHPAVAEVAGRAPRTFRDWAEAHRTDFE
ncbi:hypothetical protein GCM10022255_052430 [Dactylosporangium darangshiense]|uniref:NAD(P)-binding domain-containing protein n=1 Tax=Dactylosporangium darangshiense TaxID=579108 RepID=A0ABP8DD94_9ACTN